MISTVYIEDSVQQHERTQTLVKRFPQATKISCERYSEVFNLSSQNFRLQKKRPALILAEKFKGHVLPAPQGYGIGSRHNFYFSHMLNCVYDCRYCFLQGMYRSAHYVLFVNFEDFQKAIDGRLEEFPNDQLYFFSGYDCDSLALDSVTHFVENFIPFFASRPRAVLELRTKSVQIKGLLKLKPIENCVVAYSLVPDEIARSVEHGAPRIKQRLSAIKRLAREGWRIGLRFDPLIYHSNFEENYRELFAAVFEAVEPEQVHSISFGPMRFPKAMFDTITKLYPREKLFAGPMEKRGAMVSYEDQIEKKMMDFCRDELERYVPQALVFTCMQESEI
tara:strand:+ start:1178 stop:2182 length:1005 start_codon:yes stop_codon:yes gene_type:complete